MSGNQEVLPRMAPINSAGRVPMSLLASGPRLVGMVPIVTGNDGSGHQGLMWSFPPQFPAILDADGRILMSALPQNLTGVGTVSQLWTGALTTTAPSPSARLIGRGVLRSAILVVNDEFIISSSFIEAIGACLLGGIIAQRMIIPVAPIVLGPQDNMCLQLWFPSNAVTPPSFEVEMGWYER